MTEANSFDEDTRDQGGVDKVSEAVERNGDLIVQISASAEEIIRGIKGWQKGDSVEINRLDTEGVRSGWTPDKFYVARADVYRGGYRPESEPIPVEFFVKDFRSANNRGVPGIDSKPLGREYKLYKVMLESGVVPRAFKVEGLEDALVLEHAGRVTSEDKLDKSKGSRAPREELEELIIGIIAKFNAYALHRAPEALEDEDVRTWMRVKKPTIDDAVRYFKTYLEANDFSENELMMEGFKRNFSVFIDMYGENGTQLTHGDLRRQNIVGPDGEEWTEDNVKIVDLGSMVLANSLFSLAQFVTSAGSVADPDRWNYNIETYKRKEANALCGVRGKPSFDKEEMEKAKRRFYSAVIHSSLKGLAKMAWRRKHEPEEYQRMLKERPVLKGHDPDMYRNIARALKYIHQHAKEFKVESAGLAQVDCIRSSVDDYRDMSSSD